MYAIAQSLLEILTQQLGFEGDFTHSLTEEDAIEAFVMASLEGDIQHVRENLYLLNSKDKRGNSALGSAAINNKLEVLKILCSQGSSCQIDIEDNDGCTPLMLAASAGHEECASLLIESGAKIRRKDKNGWTPLHHACAGGCVRVMKTLVELGVDVSQETAFEETCLFLAAYAGNVESVKFLLNIGADPTYGEFSNTNVDIRLSCLK